MKRSSKEILAGYENTVTVRISFQKDGIGVLHDIPSQKWLTSSQVDALRGAIEALQEHLVEATRPKA